ncbi:MAG: hypothetical protein IT539_09460 [Bradyrhizobiaceae bacterium]|nr:hypothetical protein [Bradyrhizobiaceae bacterium]
MTALREYVEDWVAALRKSAEIDRIDSRELDRLAADAGISVAELRSFAAAWPDSAALLDRRLAYLNLTHVAQANPDVFRDMQRVCTQCGVKGRCEHDMDRDPADPVWQRYCPNVDTLRGLSRN